MAVVINGTTGVSGVDGSAGTPSYQGTDSNTGIFFPAADTIAFAEGGAEAMRIDSSGTVMIGTSTNAGGRRLNVVGRIAATNSNAVDNQLLIGADAGEAFVAATYASNGSYQPLTFYTSATERMRIDSSGNVGIGTSSPIAKLDTATTSDNNLNIIRYAESTSGAVFRIRHSYSNTIGTNTLLPGSGGGYQFGRIEFVGATGTDYAVGASIVGIALGSTSSTSMPGVLIFNTTPESSTSPTERARITSGGYFKASNSGTYNSSTGAYHEFNQSAQDIGQLVRATNGSYNSTVLEIRCSRAASADYFLIAGRSSDGTDPEFYITGAGNAYADGTWNNNGADYAEFFESANGQALTLGATVVLDGNKVREATDQDPASAIIGVVRPKEPSKASMVVGNTAWNKWANKYLTDDFDRYIMEDHDVVEWEETITDEEGKTLTKQHSYESHNIPAGVTVPADAVRKTHDDKGNKFQHYKLNPAWDKDAEYVNRENRPEWNIIGLLGQVKILKGQPVGDRWIKMRDVSATVEEWMIR